MALRAGYYGIKRGLKAKLAQIAGAWDTTIATIFPRSEQAVLGAKNVGEIILGYYVQEATTGYFKLTADANAITYIAKVEQNTDYRCKKDAYGDRFAVTGFVNYPSTTTTTAEASRLFDDSSATEHVVNTGIYNYLAFTANRTTEVAESSVKGMIYLASDPDSTYVPYAMTNKGLTDLGLVYRGAIPSEASLDNYVEVGMWDVNGTNPTNFPTGSSGYVPMLVLPRWGHGNIKQIIISGNNEIYLRNKNDGESWSSWYKFTGTVVS